LWSQFEIGSIRPIDLLFANFSQPASQLDDDDEREITKQGYLAGIHSNQATYATHAKHLAANICWTFPKIKELNVKRAIRPKYLSHSLSLSMQILVNWIIEATWNSLLFRRLTQPSFFMVN